MFHQTEIFNTKFLNCRTKFSNVNKKNRSSNSEENFPDIQCPELLKLPYWFNEKPKTFLPHREKTPPSTTLPPPPPPPSLGVVSHTPKLSPIASFKVNIKRFKTLPNGRFYKHVQRSQIAERVKSYLYLYGPLNWWNLSKMPAEDIPLKHAIDLRLVLSIITKFWGQLWSPLKVEGYKDHQQHGWRGKQHHTPLIYV